MSSVEEHYSRLLAKHYTWMFGAPFAAKVAEQRAVLEDALGASELRRGLAVDLGCGPGFQTIALAQMGYWPVVALDTSAELLEELRSHASGFEVRAVEADLLRVGEFVAAGSAAVVVCMGDTITHLGSKEDVVRLLGSVREALVPGGRVVVSYRDLSVEAKGVDRFIPVYGDEERVMMCFLEFDEPESVMVHDLVSRRVHGRWEMEKSCYRKLRLPVEWLEGAMRDVGMTVERGSAGRLVRLVGRKDDGCDLRQTVKDG
jgi:SAM-dependent methyltransferase